MREYDAKQSLTFWLNWPILDNCPKPANSRRTTNQISRLPFMMSGSVASKRTIRSSERLSSLPNEHVYCGMIGLWWIAGEASVCMRKIRCPLSHLLDRVAFGKVSKNFGRKW